MNTVPADPLLTIQDLSIEFTTRLGIIHAVRKVNLSLRPGEKLGIVGETGSGKSCSALATMRLLDKNGRVTSGQITYKGEVVASATQRYKYNQPPPGMAMIFQYPRTALNPIRMVGDQIIDVLKTMKHATKAEFREHALELLDEVKVDNPKGRFFAYPFELSGGICQRVLIAMALARKPVLLLADEPTTGLDVITQKIIMSLVERATDEHKMATVLITHNLGLAAEYCDDIGVMYEGELVELGKTQRLFHHPEHPYTALLIASTPGLNEDLDQLGSALARWSEFKRQRETAEESAYQTPKPELA